MEPRGSAGRSPNGFGRKARRSSLSIFLCARAAWPLLAETKGSLLITASVERFLAEQPDPSAARAAAAGAHPLGRLGRPADVADAFVNIRVSDLSLSRAFYERTLAPLGIGFVMEHAAGIGFGRNGRPVFWISDRACSAPVHVAFASRTGPRWTRFTLQR